MTQPHVPPGWPPTWPRRHAGPRTALAGVMAIGASVVVLVLLGALVAALLWVARNGGHW